MNIDDMHRADPKRGGLSRRQLLERTIAGGVLLSVPTVLSACADDQASSGTGETRTGAKRGGRLRVAVLGGGSLETLDLNQSVSEVDVPRTRGLYEGLLDYDENGAPMNVLAAELTPNKDATVWRIKLTEGVEFHNGKTMTSDDVVYSLTYILEPKNKAQGAAAFSGFLEPNGVKKLGKDAVEVRLSRPNAFFPNMLCGRQVKIFPDGTTARDLATKPIGTGPFKFTSWTRGERSIFAANRNYRIHGGPYVDELEIVSINEPSARVNALLSGETDALVQLDPKLVAQVEGSGHTVLDSPSGAYTCPFMVVTSEPFTDVRVRQAFRLMVDRKQMIDNALLGHGKVGNDMFSWFDPDYASDLPQREYDPEQAKSLLKQAGKEGMTIELATAEAGPVMVESATLLAEQAKASGVNVKLSKSAADQYYSGPYAKFPFASTTWPGRPLAEQFIFCVTQDAPINETNWKKPEFDAIVKDAFAELDDAKRKVLLGDAQKVLYDEGGYIIWGFLNNTDAVAKGVTGMKDSVIRPLGYYDFLDVQVT